MTNPNNQAALIATVSILAIVTIFNNVGFIITILKNKQLQTVTNWILLSLSISDFLVGAIVTPISLVNFLHTGLLVGNRCVIISSCMIYVPLVTAFHLLAVSLERYIAIVFPLHYTRFVTERTTKLAIMLCWFVPIVVCSFPIMGWNINPTGFHTNVTALHTNVTALRTDGTRPSCSITVSLPCSYLCFVLSPMAAIATVILLLYLNIFKVGARQARRIATVRPRNFPPLTKNYSLISLPEIKAVLVVFTTVGFFIATNLPVCISFYAFCGAWHIRDSVWVPVGFLAFSNSALNPLIYGLGNRDIRRTFTKCVCKRSIR